MDVKRAFLYGDIEEEIFIELPDEDPKKAMGYIGRLLKAMYGTRSAPLVWQKMVRKTMARLGFHACMTIPCLYYHKDRDIYLVAHVDDFLCSGEPEDLKWIIDELQKEYDITYDIIGPGGKAKYLGRTIEWSRSGISIEGENKYIKSMVKEWSMEGSSGLATPGCEEDKRAVGGDEVLGTLAATRFRRSAAMINYMAQDRPDLSFASKETSRGMASPTEKDVIKLKRCIRYLMKVPRRRIMYKWQDTPTTISTYSDSDWAGCLKTRKSTSGGVLMVGKHAIHHWSTTQSVVALSSAEAELNAIVKSISETLCVVNMAKECNMILKGQVMTDSTAANGIVHRQGCGKVKHLECRQLWVQAVVGGGEVTCQKVPRDLNPGDALTHYWTQGDGFKHFQRIGLEVPEGL